MTNTPKSIYTKYLACPLLGHSRITTTHCYCRVSNLKVQRDYYKAIKVVMQRTQPIRQDIIEFDKKGIMNNRT